MIASKYRLRDYEVERVFKRGRPFFGRFWTVYMLSHPRSNLARMGISISRKHDKRSVWRNRYRRKTYDTLLPYLKETMKGSSQGLQSVFILKKGLKLTDPVVQEGMLEDAVQVFQKALSEGKNLSSSLQKKDIGDK